VEQGRRDVNHSHQKNNLIQDSVENGYPVLDLNKTMINVTHKKKKSKKKSGKKPLSNSWRRYLTWLTRIL
jgi:hypothetical protein